MNQSQKIHLDGNQPGKRFDGIGVVNGGGATAVLLKDYPEPQRSQILDLVYKPKFGASVSALLVEIPGDGNATQGSMPSHMHTRDDLNYHRGYIWWVLSEAKKRNPKITLDGTAWSAPGWIGRDEKTRVPGGLGDAAFWSHDTADYYVKWLKGLRDVYGLELDAIGCRNEKDYSIAFAKILRKALNTNGFEQVKLHAFDHWIDSKFDFVKEMAGDPEAQAAIDIIGAHGLNSYEPKCLPASPEIQQLAAKMNKPIWNTESHVYKKGFDCTIGIVNSFNNNFIHSGATKIVNWYDIAGVYPMEPYPEDPATILAHWPWCGHYKVRESLWGYAHYGQFTEVGWSYLSSACGDLSGGGTMVTMKSPADDFSIIIETSGAKQSQALTFQISAGLSKKSLCVWRSNAKEIFVKRPDISVENDRFSITIEPDSIYSISTTTGQQKGSYENIPAATVFPFPYYETFDQYADPKEWGYLPRYTADIADAFEIVDRPDKNGKCLQQVVPVPTISWAPDWQPYTIIGDEHWTDYEVSADVYLNPGDSAGVMGRVNHVGTGYGFIPKGYYLELHDDGRCNLIVIRGKKDKKALVGDAEQQAILKAANDDSEGGEKILAAVKLDNVAANQWHQLKLRFEGDKITGLVDGKVVVSATDNLYSLGMAGLLAGQTSDRISRPYFNNLLINHVSGVLPAPSQSLASYRPIYQK